MSRIFKMQKTAAAEDELFQGMQEAQKKTLSEQDSIKQTGVVRAMRALNTAAECFERTGQKQYAKEVTDIMTSLASVDINDAKKSKGKKKSKPSGNEDVRKVFMFFGFSPEDLEGLDISDGDSADQE